MPSSLPSMLNGTHIPSVVNDFHLNASSHGQIFVGANLNCPSAQLI